MYFMMYLISFLNIDKMHYTINIEKFQTFLSKHPLFLSITFVLSIRGRQIFYIIIVPIFSTLSIFLAFCLVCLIQFNYLQFVYKYCYPGYVFFKCYMISAYFQCFQFKKIILTTLSILRIISLIIKSLK